MNIQRTSQLAAKRAINTGQKAAESPEPKVESEPSSSTFKDVVVKGAYASGGALAGVGLGVATGGVLNNLLNSSNLTTAGGVLGAVAGATTAVSLSDSENKGETLKKVALGWGGASVGSAAGQFFIGEGINQMASAAGIPTLAAVGPFIGTATGALVGASLPNMDTNDQMMKLVRRGAGMSLLGSIGLGVGLGGKIWALNTPGLEHMGSFGPALGAFAGASVANAISAEEGSYIPTRVARSAAGTALGYGLGSVAGGMIHSAGASGAYSLAMPAVGSMIGGLVAYSSKDYNEPELPGGELSHKAAGVLALGAGGATVGDAIGHILTAATGHEIYAQAGYIVGGLNGTAMGLDTVGLDTKKAAPVAFITSLSGAGGALVGAGLSAATGNSLYNNIGFTLGAANGLAGGLESFGIDTHKAQPTLLSGTVGLTAGGFTGAILTAATGDAIYNDFGAITGAVSGALIAADKTELLDTKGVAEGVAGVSGGTAVGALLGASLDYLTGQNLWGVALPVLGAAAGGLSAVALSFDDAGPESKES